MTLQGDADGKGIVVTTLQYDAKESLRREVEIGALAAVVRAASLDEIEDGNMMYSSAYERGARAGLTAAWECVELVRHIRDTAGDPADTAADIDLASLAADALAGLEGAL